MENNNEIITKVCLTCQEAKPLNKYQKHTRHCLSCRNKKYYKKEFFQEYYKNHTDEIKQSATTRYQTKLKVLHPRGRGRPKKEKPTPETQIDI